MATKRFVVKNGLDNSGNSSVANTIINVAEPVNNSDAATKYYVDTAVGNGLPSQTGSNGKFLTTNGTTASWSLVGVSAINATGTPSSTTYLRGDGTWATVTSSGGTVTSVSVTSANGVSGTVANATTTPAITLSLGAITPTSVASTGAVSGTTATFTDTSIIANAFRFYTGATDGNASYGDFRTNPATGNSIISAKTGALFFNFDHGTGGVNFCNGSGGTVGSVDASGNANFVGSLTQNGNQVLHAGNYTSYSPSLSGSGATGTWGISISGNSSTTSQVGGYTSDGWLRKVSDNTQFQIYGNTRSIINRTDGVTNPHGGGGYPYIWYYGGSGDAQRQMILSSDGLLWTGNYGWLHDYFATKTGTNSTGTWGINVTGYSTQVNLGNDSSKQLLGSAWAGGSGYPGYQFSGGNSRFGFSSTGGYIDVYTDGNFYAGIDLNGQNNLVLHAGNYSSYAFRAVTADGGITTPTNGLNDALQGYASYDGYGAVVPNYPNNQWWVGAFTGGNSFRGFQISGGYADSEMYFRKGNGSWQTWNRVLTNSNYSSYALPLSGGTVTGNVYLSANSQGVGASSTLRINGDLNVARGNGTTGVVYLGNSGGTYLYYDGANYIMPNGQLDVNGSRVLNAGNFTTYIPYGYPGWPGYPGTDANTYYAGNWLRSSFTYSNNAPLTGCIVDFPASGYDLQLNANYNGDALYFRSRNGDNGTWRGWKYVLTDYNYSSYALPITGGTVTGRIHSNEWIQFNNYSGLYSPLNGAHFYPNNGTYGTWRIAGSRNGWSGLEFDANNGQVSLMIDPNSNGHGFYNLSYGWQVYWTNGTLYCFKNSYGGGTQATVLDSANYTSYAISRGTDTVDNLHYFRSNKGSSSYNGSQADYNLQAYSNDGGSASMSFHRGGYYAINMGLDPDNVFRIGGWSASANRLQLDMSGNLTVAGSMTANGYRIPRTIVQSTTPAGSGYTNGDIWIQF